MSPYLIGILRAVHVLAACLWVGTNILNGFFLIPSLRAAGPAGGQVSRQLIQVRRLPIYINIAAVLVLVSGGFLIWNVSGGLSTYWFASRFGVLLSVGAAAAIGAAIHGQIVIPPAAARMGRLAAEAQSAGGPPPPEVLAEIGRVQHKLERATRAEAVMTSLAAVLMASARYW